MSEDLKAAALSYDFGNTAPLLLAFGKNKLAEAIINIARENGIPVKEEKEEILALLENCEQGSEIPELLWEAAAKIFAYLYSIESSKKEAY